MIDRIEIRSRTAERTVLGFGILLILLPVTAVLSGVEITERFFGARDLFSLGNIGEVLRPSKIVKRKGEEDLAYETAKQGDPIHIGDTVMTGKESFTRITLTDGTTLELGPESLVKIDTVRTFSFAGIQRKLRVTVMSGKVKVLSTPNSAPVVLQNRAGEVIEEIAPSLSDSPSQPVALPVSSPSAAIPEEPLSKPTFVRPAFTLNPEPTATPPPLLTLASVPVLTSPPDRFDAGTLPRIGGHRDLVLAWKRNPLCRKYEVRVVRSGSPEAPLLKKRTVLNFSGFRIPGPGHYEWLVGCVTEENTIGFSKPREFLDSGK